MNGAPGKGQDDARKHSDSLLVVRLYWLFGCQILREGTGPFKVLGVDVGIVLVLFAVGSIVMGVCQPPSRTYSCIRFQFLCYVGDSLEIPHAS
jgi:hypothetical protein